MKKRTYALVLSMAMVLATLLAIPGLVAGRAEAAR